MTLLQILLVCGSLAALFRAFQMAIRGDAR
jgi:hypothetical protein